MPTDPHVDGQRPQGNIDWGAVMRRLAEDVWGAPDYRHDHEWRWGKNGGRKIDLEAGTWKDFTSGAGGGVLDFVIAHHWVNDEAAAVAWLVEHGHVPAAAPQGGYRADYDKMTAQRSDLRRRRDAEAAERAERAKAIWAAAEAVSDVARAEAVFAGYLQGRGIAYVPMTARVLPYKAARALGLVGVAKPPGFPCIVWPYVGDDGEVGAVQVLALRHDPDKGWVKAWKKSKTYGSPPRASCIPLAPPRDGRPFIIGEGAETVLAGIAVTGYGGVACMGSGRLGDFVPPPEVTEVIVADDNDATGSDELNKLAPRLLAAGIVVRFLRYAKEREHYDWNDAVMDGRDLGADIDAAPLYAADTDESAEPTTAFDTTLDTTDAGTPAPAAESAPWLSEEALALAFSDRHAATLRYVAAWGHWLAWDDRRWREDTTLAIFDLARHICREAAARVEKASLAKSVTRAATVAAVEKLAKADRRHAATVDVWDRDLHLINTPGGIVNLTSGALLPHAPERMMTRMTSVAPAEAECPLWDRFLAEIMDGNQELIGFLQRFYGYALTGDTSEQVLSFNYGTGANGKSVLNGTLAGIFGDYYRNAPVETFTLASGERHPTEVAMLRGARLVTSNETEDGRRWNETRLKELTGGEVVEARFMRQDFFAFRPQFKLVVTGNHKPALRNVDEAIRRRFLLVPFAVTIPPQERDPQLAARLVKEWPAILHWLIEGAVAWHRNGLQVPAKVRTATDDYLKSEDAFGLWLAECCIVERQAWAWFKHLYDDYKLWAERSSEHIVSRKRFGQILQERPEGFERSEREQGAAYIGLRPLRFVDARYDDYHQDGGADAAGMWN